MKPLYFLIVSTTTLLALYRALPADFSVYQGNLAKACYNDAFPFSQGKWLTQVAKADTEHVPLSSSKTMRSVPVSLVSSQQNGSKTAASGNENSVDLFFNSSDFAGEGINSSPFELKPTGVTAGTYSIGNTSITLDSKGRITAIKINGSNVPAAPAVHGDDNLNTLSASHVLGTSEISVSTDNSSFVQYNGAVINVGNVSRPAGYWKFKIIQTNAHSESGIVSSPAFTVDSSGIAKTERIPKDVIIDSTIFYGQLGTDFIESPAHTYSSKTRDVVFLSNNILPANTDGMVYSSYPSTGSAVTFLGLDETKHSIGLHFGAYPNSITGTYYYIDGTDNIDTGVPIIAGANVRFGIKRTGATLTEIISDDGGATWKDIHVYRSTTLAALHVKFFNYQPGNTIVNPKIFTK